jgi:hypothetical protein
MRNSAKWDFEKEPNRNLVHEELNKSNKNLDEGLNHRLDQVDIKVSEPEDRYFETSHSDRMKRACKIFEAPLNKHFHQWTTRGQEDKCYKHRKLP